MFTFFAPLPARAQTSEAGHALELAILDWRPAATLRVSSDAPNIVGTSIDIERDLNAPDRQIPAVQVVWHPVRRHRLRFEFIPIRFDSSAILGRDIVFSGTTYRRGDAVTSTFHWMAYNAGYEYDFVTRPRATIGVVAEIKGTTVDQTIAGTAGTEARHTNVPAPALGAAVRVQASPRITLATEFRGFVIPDSKGGHYGGRYVDVDANATARIVNHVAVRGGLRWLNIRHLGQADSAHLSLPGIYAGAVFTIQ